MGTSLLPRTPQHRATINIVLCTSELRVRGRKPLYFPARLFTSIHSTPSHGHRLKPTRMKLGMLKRETFQQNLKTEFYQLGLIQLKD